MIRLSVDKRTVASWCVFYDELTAKGYPPASGAVSYRVGVVIGWLSALSISQKEDVQAALVILVALVKPFLSSSQKPTAQLGRVKLIGKPKKGGKRGAR